jgi:hypothetical protein
LMRILIALHTLWNASCFSFCLFLYLHLQLIFWSSCSRCQKLHSLVIWEFVTLGWGDHSLMRLCDDYGRFQKLDSVFSGRGDGGASCRTFSKVCWMKYRFVRTGCYWSHQSFIGWMIYVRVNVLFSSWRTLLIWSTFSASLRFGVAWDWQCSSLYDTSPGYVSWVLVLVFIFVLFFVFVFVFHLFVHGTWNLKICNSLCS